MARQPVLTNPGDKEDLVIHREAKCDAEQQHRNVGDQRARWGWCPAHRGGRPGRSTPARRNAAVSDKTLHTRAFTGSTTLPVSKNSSTNAMMRLMSPSTSGRRAVIACTLSRLIWATPAISTDWPGRTGHGVQPVELGVGGLREQRRGGWRPSKTRCRAPRPVAADGGPTRLPATNVPVGAETAVTSATRDRSAAYRLRSPGRTPRTSGTTTGTAVAESSAKS